MPVVSGIPQDCPRCGAPLPPAKEGRTVCKYCRNTVSIDVKQPRHPARRAASTFPWFRAQLLWTLISVLGVGGWQVVRLISRQEPLPFPTPPGPIPTLVVASSDAPSAPPAGRDLVTHVVSKLLLINATNDVQQDCAAIATLEGAESGQWLLAINGRTGRTIWRHELPSGTNPSETEFATSAGSVFVRTPRELLQLRAKDGAVVWQAASSVGSKTNAGRLCATSAYVGVTVDSPPTEAWDWKTGRVLQVKAGGCEPMYSTNGAGSNFDYAEAEGLSKVVVADKGFTPLRGLVPHSGNARVILGERAKGNDESATPLVGVTANRRWVWQAELSEHAFAAFPSPPIAAVRRESVVVPYWDPQNKVLRLTALGLERGQRQWDIGLGDQAALPFKTDIDVVLSLDGAVFARTSDGRVSAYTLSTGTPLWNM